MCEPLFKLQVQLLAATYWACWAPDNCCYLYGIVSGHVTVLLLVVQQIYIYCLKQWCCLQPGNQLPMHDDFFAFNNPWSAAALLCAVTQFKYQAANLTTALDNGKPYTILAPTNASFAAALSKLGLTQEALLADKPLLTKILSYHVIPGAAVLSTQLNDGQKVDTLLTDESTRQPAQLTVKVKGSGGVEFDGASSSAVVVIPDIKAGNTVVHVIDTVLVPPGVAPAATSGRK